MLRKGARDKRGLNNRHMGTLSISVHEDEEEGTTKPSSLDVQTQEVGRPSGNTQSPDHKWRACGRELQ